MGLGSHARSCRGSAAGRRAERPRKPQPEAGQHALQVLADTSLQSRQIASLQRLADGRTAGGGGHAELLAPVQFGKKSTADALDDYAEVQQDEDDAYDDVADELWSDQDEVIQYALRKLDDCRYANWHDTDASQGDYCRFIWYFDYGVKVGLNVHYPVGAAKAAGNMYIEGVAGFQLPTPAAMVANAPAARPTTTKTWR